ncbi:hypothetical protein Aperf_G00000033668 [Anoplocephala perfoliata]
MAAAKWQSSPLYVLDVIADQDETTGNGLRLLSPCHEFGVCVVNSFFRKSDQGRFTWYHPTGEGSVLDFILMKRSRRLLISEVRATSDYCLLMAIVKCKVCDRGHHLGRRGRWKIWQTAMFIDRIRSERAAYREHLKNALDEMPSNGAYKDILSSVSFPARGTGQRTKGKRNPGWYIANLPSMVDEAVSDEADEAVFIRLYIPGVQWQCYFAELPAMLKKYFKATDLDRPNLCDTTRVLSSLRESANQVAA